MAKVRVRSRLRFSGIRRIDGIEFWDLVEMPDFPVQPDDSYHTVQDYERIDQLAFKYYNDPILWPVIAAANNMELVPSALNVGDRLRIPSARYVQEEVFKTKGKF